MELTLIDFHNDRSLYSKHDVIGIFCGLWPSRNSCGMTKEICLDMNDELETSQKHKLLILHCEYKLIGSQTAWWKSDFIWCNEPRGLNNKTQSDSRSLSTFHVDRDKIRKKQIALWHTTGMYSLAIETYTSYFISVAEYFLVLHHYGSIASQLEVSLNGDVLCANCAY